MSDLRSPLLRAGADEEESEIHVEKRLISSRPPELVAAPSSLSLCHRLSVVGLATLWSFLIGGMVFGWAPLALLMSREGVYRELCAPGETECDAQAARFARIFNIGSSCFNIILLPSGILLDFAGPRTTALAGMGAFLAGSVLFGLSTSESFDWFSVGMALMAIGGPAIGLCAFNTANLFPARRGMIMSLVSQANNSTSILYCFLELAYVGLGAPGYRVIFLWAYPLIVAAAALSVPFVWKRKLYDVPPPAPTPYLPIGKQVATKELASLVIWRQLISFEWLLMTATICIHVLHVNFYIGTVGPQISWALGSSSVDLWTQIFGYVLPLGGMLLVPVIGAMVDHRGVNESLLHLSLTGVVFSLCSIPRHPAFTALTFVSLACYRGLLFGVMSVFVMKLFGGKSFGRLWGAAMAMAAIFNASGSGLDHLAHTTLGGNYTYINIGFAVLSAATVALPVYMYARDTIASQRAAAHPLEEVSVHEVPAA